jgi:hypothetical protein
MASISNVVLLERDINGDAMYRPRHTVSAVACF